MQVVGSNIEGLLESGRVKEVLDHLVQWHCQAWVKQDHPTREGLDQEMADRA